MRSRRSLDDIKAILHNMKREADAKEQLFQKAMGLMDSCAVGLEAFPKKELTHFLGEQSRFGGFRVLRHISRYRRRGAQGCR